MGKIGTILKKEFKSYFNSPIAYIYITTFLVLSNWLFFRGFFIINQADMRAYFQLMPWIFLFFVPAVSMRAWAEEKKTGTMELLMTLPVKDYEAVIGKFLAGFLFLGISLFLSFTLPLTIGLLGSPDRGPIIGGYLGIFFLGGAYLAIGLFISSLTENQIIAFIIGITLSFVFFVVGENIVLFATPDWLAPILEYLGMGNHLESISRGVIDSRDLIYYLSVMAFFLYLNVRSLESRKWK